MDEVKTNFLPTISKYIFNKIFENINEKTLEFFKYNKLLEEEESKEEAEQDTQNFIAYYKENTDKQEDMNFFLKYNISKILCQEITKETIWNIIMGIYERKIVLVESYKNEIKYELKDSFFSSKFYTNVELKLKEEKELNESVTQSFLVNIHQQIPTIILNIYELDIQKIFIDKIICKIEILGSIPLKKEKANIGEDNLDYLKLINLDVDIPLNSTSSFKNINSVFMNNDIDKRKEISITNTSEYAINNKYQCNVFLTSTDDSIFSDIDYVTYLLHPTFIHPTATTSNAKEKFKITLYVWGEFEIKAKVVYKNKRIDLLSHWLHIS